MRALSFVFVVLLALSALSQPVVDPAPERPSDSVVDAERPARAPSANQSALSLQPVTNAITPAGDISAGQFGANTGGGYYTFPSRVGFGTKSPRGLLHAFNGAFYVQSVLDSATAYGIEFWKSRGVPDAITPVVANDSVGFVSFTGWDGTVHRGVAMIGAAVDGDMGTMSVPGRLVFSVSNAASGTSVERMRLNSQGFLGIGTSNPTKKLDVNGDVRVIGTTYLNITTPLLTGDSVSVGTGLGIQRFGGSGSAPNLTFTGARGTESDPQPSGIGDETGRLLFRGWDGAAETAPLVSARFGAIVDAAVSAGSVPQALIFKTGSTNTPAERMRINSNGWVGIGTATPLAQLHVAGDVKVDGNVIGMKVIGAVYQDVAEWVPATHDLAPGTVVVLNPTTPNEVMASQTAYDTTVAGVVSAQPGVILGVEAANKEQIATTGRVKVRVDARTSPVRIGDLLVTSDIAGVAMRSKPMEINGRRFHQPGTIIGKALEPLESGVGEILVLLSLQ